MGFFYMKNPGVQQDRIPPYSYCYPAVFLWETTTRVNDGFYNNNPAGQRHEL